ncbi:MAG: ATP-binding protein [Bacteroidales bacterium]|nr:ATP-binding protein [Bacteroidales bacterium]
MFEIVIISGKGGTGKTTVAASIAVLEKDNSVIADCDVDAANMHLLLKPDRSKKEKYFSGKTAVIHANNCTACGKCAEVCEFDAVLVKDGIYSIDPFFCEGCGYCARVCPDNAIEMLDADSGYLFESVTRIGSPMAHARLHPAADNSGKLVAEVKNRAKRMAAESAKEYIIVDGAPGIGCPVISSLAGASYVILVTEPSTAALHDLKRLVALLQKFKLKAGCLINKAELHPEMVQQIIQYLEKEKIDLLGILPFDQAFPDAIAAAKAVVETNEHMKKLMASIWENTKSKLKAV